jgi:hypothetical protein
MTRLVDSSGNVLLIENVMRYDGVDIFIRLANESHRRLIGRVNFKTRILHVERDSAKHVLLKANAYGFNYYILNNAKKFDTVALHETDTGAVFKMGVRFMLNEGDFLFFKEQGFEKQIFLTREWIDHYKVSEIAASNLRSEYKLNV